MSVLAYIEPNQGAFKKSALELVSFGKEIANNMGVTLNVLVYGQADDENLASLAPFGADKILQLNSEEVFDTQRLGQQIASTASDHNAKLLVFQHNTNGKALAPRVAFRLSAGVAAGVTAAPLSYDPIVFPKKVYTGKALGNIRIDSPVSVATLSQNSFGLKEVSGAGEIEKIGYADGLAEAKTVSLEVNKLDGKLLLTDAEIVVAGGRGMKGPENWGPLEELAEVLGGATACSRPVSDEGWRPHHEHVGQTGKIIAPNIYFALGISGAIQHIAGVSGTKCQVAVNKDPEAPVFETSDYGIVGDVMEVLPQMIESFKAFKANS